MVKELIIRNTSEVTLEQLYEMQQSGIRYNIVVKDKNVHNKYNIETFIAIKRRILEYIQNIPQISLDDPDREKKLFTYIYIQIGQNIIYDEKAATYTSYTGYFREMTGEIVEAANNLERRDDNW